MRLIHFVLLVLTVLVISCKPSGPKLESLDLLSQGLPLKITAPADVEITSNDLGIMKDVTVRNDQGYSIQIFESSAVRLDVKEVLSELKEEIEKSAFFSKIISEDDGGFIFEKKVDEDYINYDFRHAKVRGDKQYIIQTGLSDQYTLDQVKIMYRSVQ